MTIVWIQKKALAPLYAVVDGSDARLIFFCGGGGGHSIQYIGIENLYQFNSIIAMIYMLLFGVWCVATVINISVCSILVKCCMISLI